VRRLVAVLVAACGSSAPPPAPPAPPAPTSTAVADAARACREAAVGLERATRAVRGPESSIVRAMNERCIDDAWPEAAAACFAKMTGDDDLARCAGMLADRPRRALLDVIGGGGGRAAIAVARLRLQGLTVGIGACDRFVAAVADVLACEQMPLDTRVDLGNSMADFWDLPTTGLPADAQHRMADVCDASLAQLQAEATSVGCAL